MKQRMRNITAIVLAVAFMLQLSMIAAAAETSGTDIVVPGDVTGDGEIWVYDALLVFAGVAGHISMDEDFRVAADFNGDGKINMMDALRIFKKASGY